MMSTLMFYFQEIPNLSSGPENGFPDAEPSWFSSDLSRKLYQTTLPSGKSDFVIRRNGVQIATVTATNLVKILRKVSTDPVGTDFILSHTVSFHVV